MVSQQPLYPYRCPVLNNEHRSHVHQARFGEERFFPLLPFVAGLAVGPLLFGGFGGKHGYGGPYCGPYCGPMYGPNFGPGFGPSYGPSYGPNFGPNFGPMVGPNVGPGPF